MADEKLKELEAIIEELQRKNRDLEEKVNRLLNVKKEFEGIKLFSLIRVDELRINKMKTYEGTVQSTPSAPTGGLTVDAEARTAINSIISVLSNLGITS